MRFERELDGYLTYLKANRGLSENTRSAYARDVRSCLEAMQRRGVAELGEITLDDLRMWMAGESRTHARSSMARRVVAVRGFFFWAHEHGMIPSDPAATLMTPKHYEINVLAALEEGNDIVIGSRFLTVKKPKTLRMLGSYIISWSIRLTTGRAICDPTSGMRMFNRAMVEEFAQNLNYGPEPDTISYLIKNGATVKEVQVQMGERTAGQSYLNLWNSIQYMVKMSISILLIQWFRKRDTETPYPERSL